MTGTESFAAFGAFTEISGRSHFGRLSPLPASATIGIQSAVERQVAVGGKTFTEHFVGSHGHR